jgi:formamidopyrimidine-DNA glycosylase
MPELPEVETTASDLRPELVGQQIIDAHVRWERTIATPTVAAFIAGLRDRRIVRVGRRGKYLLLSLDSGDTLIIHLRMTGGLRVEPAGSPALDSPHLRVMLDLSDGRHLAFQDQRKFGRMWLVDDPDAVLMKLGPEPLESAFTAGILAERIARRRVAIKSLLLDQAVVAGLGNIYADEALFLAHIHPLRRAAGLDAVEVEHLYEAINLVLREAVMGRGTTIRNYRPPLGDAGHYQEQRRVYQRAGLPCPACGTPIVRLVIAQRSAHFCPHCQPLLQT